MTKAIARSEPGAGHPFLTFLNSVADDGKTRRINSFQNATVLVRQLEEEGFAAPSEPVTPIQLRKILTLRETAYAAFSAIAAGRAPGREDALYLSEALKAVYQDAEIGIGEGQEARPGIFVLCRFCVGFCFGVSLGVDVSLVDRGLIKRCCGFICGHGWQAQRDHRCFAVKKSVRRGHRGRHFEIPDDAFRIKNSRREIRSGRRRLSGLLDRCGAGGQGCSQCCE